MFYLICCEIYTVLLIIFSTINLNFSKTVYIALGSNEGERFKILQSALDQIFLEVGDVQQTSRVYETPAWGFSGNSFLNACVKVSTRFTAEEVLQELLKIEANAGRKRSESKNYQNRSLDLDIIFYEDKVIKTENLVVPHPQMQHRKFVLMPLVDIAAREIHPLLEQSVSSLLSTVDDKAEINIIAKTLSLPKHSFSSHQFNYVAVEGNIGAGKTSFSTMVSQDFNAKLILERFKDNPFLPKFYENKERYAFPLEMSFLADRYQQLSDDLAQYDLFKDFVISDYDVFKSLIFAQITLPEEEFSLYHKLFHLMYKELVKPDLYIYLYQDTGRLLENIKSRGRDYEQNIQPEYLMEINKSYLNFIKTQTNMKVQIIDISGKDFVNNRADYLEILGEIKAPQPPKGE